VEGNSFMINKQDIMEEAKKHNLPPNTIEKDYVLSWILAGISESKQLKDDWIFKGGTCLKKCYFETYRFSEDLDFTVLNMQHRDHKYLKTVFGEIAEWIYEQAGLELPDEAIGFELYKNPSGEPSIQGKIAYKGPCRDEGAILQSNSIYVGMKSSLNPP
jgi:hypothetical protein